MCNGITLVFQGWFRALYIFGKSFDAGPRTLLYHEQNGSMRRPEKKVKITTVYRVIFLEIRALHRVAQGKHVCT